jgi:hypothetical protein
MRRLRTRTVSPKSITTRLGMHSLSRGGVIFWTSLERLGGNAIHPLEDAGSSRAPTYWMNRRSNVQFNFRHQKVSQQFIPSGETLTDFGASADYWFRHHLGVFRPGTRTVALSGDSTKCVPERDRWSGGSIRAKEIVPASSRWSKPAVAYVRAAGDSESMVGYPTKAGMVATAP